MTDYPDNPRSAPLTYAELAALGAEPTPADSLDECRHAGACLRAYGMFALGGEVDTERMFWMDECAAALGCAECDEYEE